MASPLKSLVCKIQHQSRMYDVFISLQLHATLKLMSSTPKPCMKNAGNMLFAVCRTAALEDVRGIKYSRLSPSIDHLLRELVSRP